MEHPSSDPGPVDPFASATHEPSKPGLQRGWCRPGDDGFMNESQRVAATERAIGVIPGMAAAKLRGDKEGALTLLRAYRTETRAMGLDEADMWSCLTAASLVQFELVVQQAADIADTSPEQLLMDMGLRALKAGLA